MSLSQSRRDSLRHFASRVVDHLADARTGTLKQLVTDVLSGLAKRTDADCVQLYSVRETPDGTAIVSLNSQWSASGVPMSRKNLEQVPLQLFSGQAAGLLVQGQPAFAALSPDHRSCSKLVTAILLETQSTGLLLIPVTVKGRFRGFLGLAHSHGAAHLGPDDCRSAELVGKLIIRRICTVRRTSRLRREHRQWKRVADAACDFAIVIDASHEIRRVVPFGQKQIPGVVGMRIEDFVFRQCHADLFAAMKSAKMNLLTATCDVKANRSDGSECWYRVRIEPGAFRRTSGCTLFLTDNDVMHSRQEEVRKLREHLNRASRLSLLGQISSEFAHQINQPLQAITTYCGAVEYRERQGQGTKEKTLASIASILTSVEHASQILNRIRQFVQFKELTLSPVDLRFVIDRALMMTMAAANENGVELRTENPLPDAAECLVNSDPETESEYVGLVDQAQTTHVLINLIVNAIEACVTAKIPQPKIVVSVLPQKRYHSVRVTDNGPGIPADNPDIVFEQFHTTKPEGLGIGLAISRGVIEAQHGRLSVSNNPGPGCTFEFTVRRTDLSLSDTAELRVIRPGEIV